MTRIQELVSYVDELLATEGTPDYPTVLNGLHLEYRAEL